MFLAQVETFSTMSPLPWANLHQCTSVHFFPLTFVCNYASSKYYFVLYNSTKGQHLSDLLLSELGQVSSHCERRMIGKLKIENLEWPGAE